MKKSLLALLVATSTISMTANADVFIDEKMQDKVAVVKKEVVEAQKAQVSQKIHAQAKSEKPVVRAIKAEKVEAPKTLKTRNVVKKIDLKQEISTFEHVGKKQTSTKIQGFSNDVSVKQALEQLVPEDWNINVSNKVDLDKKVSFAGGKTWNDTLEVVGKDNFSAVFDWNNKNLVVTPTTLSHKAETITSTEEVGKVQKAVKATKKVVKKPVAKKTTSGEKSYAGKKWLLNKNYTLRQNIEMWGKRAGWTVAWNAPDYNVVSNTTLTGEIDSENGPIISILKLYEDSNLPLKVNIMGGNKVINVESRNYVPRDSIDISRDFQ